MSKLFENAVQSIILGLEDYQATNPARTLSAVRNFYAGMLLLAKEVLIRTVPDADERDLLAANYKPVPNRSGGIKIVARSRVSIDLDGIGTRFKDFGLSIDRKALEELSQIRNDVEHGFPEKTRDLMKVAIAKAFPVAYELFHQAGEEPHVVLKDAWQTMLEVRTIYERELKACSATFDKIDWLSDILSSVGRVCPECQSDLVAQSNIENRYQHEIIADCHSCGATISAEKLVEKSMAMHLDSRHYVVARYGGVDPLQTCPDCNLDTYIVGEDDEDDSGCVWCECKLGDCSSCATKLTPDDVGDRHDMCAYCDYKLAKE